MKVASDDVASIRLVSLAGIMKLIIEENEREAEGERSGVRRNEMLIKKWNE